MGLLTVQSASVVNELNIDPDGHMEIEKEPNKHDYHSLEAAAPAQDHDGSLEETGMVAGGSVGMSGRRRRWTRRRRNTPRRRRFIGGRRRRRSKLAEHLAKVARAAAAEVRRHAEALAADARRHAEALAKAAADAIKWFESLIKWQMIPPEDLMLKFCDMCAQNRQLASWSERDIDACQGFKHFSKDKIKMPDFVGELAFVNTLSKTKCFWPSVVNLPFQPPAVIIDWPPPLNFRLPDNIRKTCGCLKKLFGPDEDQGCKSEDCTNKFMWSCKGFCAGFKEKVVPGFSLVETHKQNRSAIPEPKALMRSERRVSDRTVSDRTVSEQVLMRQEAAQESTQESGTLDETLEDKCAA